MAVTLVVDAQAKISGVYADTQGSGGTSTMKINAGATKKFTSGTASNQADQYITKAGTIATSTTVAIPLSAATTRDAFGQLLTMVELKGIYLKSDVANTTNIQLGGNAQNVAIFGNTADFLILPAGGTFLWVSPPNGAIAVASGDNMDVENPSGSATVAYEIIMWGASA